jgi:acyl-coenzyme A thioesterase PaaI-like protein
MAPMTSIQSQIKGNFCWGCGADNHAGLQLQSWWEDDGTTVARWTPAPEHAAGPRHVVNGGIIATLLDCHGVCTAIADLYRQQGREIGSDPDIWCATTSMHVDYLRPTPLGPEITIRGAIADGAPEDRIAVECTLEAEGKERARARVEAVQVPDEWRRSP